jgi:uncharacterized protein (DUF2384 family)
VQGWEHGADVPSPLQAERIAVLAELAQRCTRVMQADYVAIWLRNPVPLLDDQAPLDVIAQGEPMRVSQIISTLESTPVM